MATPDAARRPIATPFGPSVRPVGAKCVNEPRPIANAAAASEHDRPDLQHREHVLHERALREAPRVDPREHGDDGRSDELSARQREGAEHEDDVALPCAHADPRQELRERDRDGRVEAGLDDEEQRPPVEERDPAAERLAQEHVLTARVGQHGREFGIRERAEQRQGTGRRPEAQPDRRRGDVSRHDRRGDEIPDPIIDPTMIVVAEKTPRRRSSRCPAGTMRRRGLLLHHAQVRRELTSLAGRPDDGARRRGPGATTGRTGDAARPGTDDLSGGTASSPSGTAVSEGRLRGRFGFGRRACCRGLRASAGRRAWAAPCAARRRRGPALDEPPRPARRPARPCRARPPRPSRRRSPRGRRRRTATRLKLSVQLIPSSSRRRSGMGTGMFSPTCRTSWGCFLNQGGTTTAACRGSRCT